LKVLTANSLATGEVLFRAAQGWSPRFADSQRFADEAAAAVALAAAEGEPTVTVAPYLIDVEALDGGFVPTAFRERLRALGPSNHPQHGKQAEGDADVEALKGAAFAARSAGRVKLIRR
jgi:hypothetical protein